MQLVKLKSAFLTHLSRTSVYLYMQFNNYLSLIWLKCGVKYTEKHLWETKIYFNVIRIETCVSYI